MSDTRSIGDNVSPDYAETLALTLDRDYAELTRGAQELLDEARTLPSVIRSEEELSRFATLIKRLRDTAARIETFRITEKEPYMRSAQAVDGFFFGWFEKLSRRNKTSKPGAADVLQATVDTFMQAKLAEERRIREEAQRVARLEEERLRREQAEAQRRADEAAAAASRARNAANIAAHEKQALEEAARAEQLRAASLTAAQATDDARIDLLAKPADMVRTRLDNGMVTMKRTPVVLIEDASLLDKELLWAHIDEKALLAAVKQWAKTTNYKREMAGATIRMVDESVVR